MAGVDPAASSRIFISYRRQDTPGYAGRLSDDLRDRFGPDQVFMDIDTLRPGADFVEAIQSAVGACDAPLPVGCKIPFSTS